MPIMAVAGSQTILLSTIPSQRVSSPVSTILFASKLYILSRFFISLIKLVPLWILDLVFGLVGGLMAGWVSRHLILVMVGGKGFGGRTWLIGEWIWHGFNGLGGWEGGYHSKPFRWTTITFGWIFQVPGKGFDS